MKAFAVIFAVALALSACASHDNGLKRGIYFPHSPPPATSP